MKRINTEKKNKICFFPGVVLSTFGSAIFTFITGLYLLDYTQSGIYFALNFSARLLPLILLSPIFGMLSDRFSKKKLILVADMLNFFLFLYISVVWKEGGNNIPLIYCGSILSGSLSNLVFINFQVGKPQLFAREWMAKVNSYTVMIASLTEIASPVIGAFLYSFFEIRAVFLGIALAYLISALFECFLEFREQKKMEEIVEFSFLGEIKQNSKLLKYTLLFLLLNMNLSLVLFIVVPYVLKVELQVSDKIYGIVQSILPIGMLVGSFFVGRKKIKMNFLFLRKAFMKIVIISFSFLVATAFSINQAIALGVYSLGLFLLGSIGASSDVVLFSYFQTELPDYIRGKFIGFFIGSMKMSVLLTVLVSGALIDVLSPMASILLACILSVITYLYLFKYIE